MSMRVLQPATPKGLVKPVVKNAETVFFIGRCEGEGTYEELRRPELQRRISITDIHS